ncbi:MAG TPA: hypothetical protein DCO75_02150 [Fibrobacteres bacterium]|jgi:hypothetical protein|nr:hypothetical protein [Fibrobacterota bacterium]
MDEELQKILSAICDQIEQLKSRYDTTDQKIENVEAKISNLDTMIHAVQKQLDEEIMQPANEYMNKVERDDFAAKINEKIGPYSDDLKVLNGDTDIPGQLYDEYDSMDFGDEKPDRMEWAAKQLDGIFEHLEQFKEKYAASQGVDPKEAVLEVSIPPDGKPTVEIESKETEKNENESDDELKKYEEELSRIKI